MDERQAVKLSWSFVKDKESYNNTYAHTITANTHSPMLNNMDVDGRNSTRSLRPREHMDKLSEYISNTIICYADYYMFHSEIMFCVFFLSLRIYSKTKNRQWILSFSSRNEKEKREKTKQKE